MVVSLSPAAGGRNSVPCFYMSVMGICIGGFRHFECAAQATEVNEELRGFHAVGQQ